MHHGTSLGLVGKAACWIVVDLLWGCCGLIVALLLIVRPTMHLAHKGFCHKAYEWAPHTNLHSLCVTNCVACCCCYLCSLCYKWACAKAIASFDQERFQTRPPWLLLASFSLSSSKPPNKHLLSTSICLKQIYPFVQHSLFSLSKFIVSSSTDKQEQQKGPIREH